MMTPEQETHLQEIKNHFDKMVDNKYRKGQQEHGGNLFDLDPLQLVNQAIEECIDQFTYLATLRDQILKGVSER